MNTITQETILQEAMRHREALVAYAFALLRNWASAEDVFQESLLIMAKKWEEFRPDGEILAWARGIVRFKALDALRAGGREQLVGDEELFGLIDRRFQERLTDEFSERLAAMKTALETCVGKLGKVARMLLLSFYRDGLSANDLAQRERRSVNGLRVELFRIRQALRRCCARAMPGILETG